MTIKASKGENEQEGKINVSWRISSIRVRFNDSVLADINVSTRFKLPSDKEKFRKMALEFRSQENLITWVTFIYNFQIDKSLITTIGKIGKKIEIKNKIEKNKITTYENFQNYIKKYNLNNNLKRNLYFKGI